MARLFAGIQERVDDGEAKISPAANPPAGATGSSPPVLSPAHMHPHITGSTGVTPTVNLYPCPPFPCLLPLHAESCFVFLLIDEVESLTSARKAAVSGSEPSDAVRVVNAGEY